jgi:hypothetical protein
MKKPITRKFPKQFLKDLIWDEEPELDGKTGVKISDDITDTGRWSIHHSMIFSYDEKFYLVNYSVGATEQQDERPFEYEGPEIDTILVAPIEKTVIVYTTVYENDSVQGHESVNEQRPV